MEENTPYQLIAKHLSGETSMEEDEVFYQWLSEKEEHHHLFEELLLVYQATGRIEKPPLANKVTSPFWWQMAAAILLLISSIYIFSHYNPENHKSIRNSGLSVIEVDISTGIKLWLNGHSQLDYHIQNDSIFMTINGEAYIEANEENPLTIVVQQNDVQIISKHGELNINHYRNLADAKLTLFEGDFLLIDQVKQNMNLSLMPGHEVDLVKDYGIVSISDNTNPNHQSWRFGQFYFSEKSLFQIAKSLENQLNIEIKICDDHVADALIEGFFEVKNSKELLFKLIEYESLILEKRKNQIIIKSKTLKA